MSISPKYPMPLFDKTTAKPRKIVHPKAENRQVKTYVSTLTTKLDKSFTPQTEPLLGRESEMTINSEGGFSFILDEWKRLDRFLILGSDKPTMYATARKLTIENAANVLECIKKDGLRTVNTIVQTSSGGRAPKNEPALLALALCAIHGDSKTVAFAYDNLSAIARTGTHLFFFVECINSLGKWNAAACRGVSNWYNGRGDQSLIKQLLKYQNRNGWSHRDVLRLAHPKPMNDERSALYNYVTNKKRSELLPIFIHAYDEMHSVPMESGAPKSFALSLIKQYPELVSWEMLPTELHKDKDVMMALLPNMGLTAIIRRLGPLSAMGLISNLSEASSIINAKLSDAEAIKGARVHPITLLSAMNQYKQGHGSLGKLTWKADSSILKTLEHAFYDSFDYLPSTGEKYLLGIDCSGSMFSFEASGINLTAAEVAAVMALALIKRENNWWIGGFDTAMSELKIKPHMDLKQVQSVMKGFRWGGTDCAVPMIYAKKLKMDIDKFVIYTDNETYAGAIHPVEALARYRSERNPRAKLIVAGVSSNGFTIADPKDAGMMDIVGFSSDCPKLIQEF